MPCSKSLTGLEFDDLSPPEQADAAAALAVFSRVEPQHKSKLVDLLRAQVGGWVGGEGKGLFGRLSLGGSPGSFL